MPKDTSNYNDTIWSNAENLIEGYNLAVLRTSGLYAVTNPVNGPAGSGNYIVSVTNAKTDAGNRITKHVYYNTTDGTIEHRTYSAAMNGWSTAAPLAASGSGSTNLGTTADATTVTISSDTGDDAVIPLVDGVNAGVMDPADKTKLDGIEVGATADQTDADIEAAYNNQVAVATQAEAEAGIITTVLRFTPELIKQAILALSVGSTNLSRTLSPTTIVVESDTGTDATLPAVDGVNAGLMIPGDKTKLDGVEASATADQTDAEITTAYTNQVAVVSQAQAEAGTLTTVLRWTPERIKQAILALASGVTNLTRTLSPTTIVVESDTGTDAILPAVDGVNAGLMIPGDKTKLDGVEANATADQTDAEIETAYNTQVPVVSQAQAEAGILTTVLRWTPVRIKQAIDAIASGATNLSFIRDATTVTVQSDTGTDAIIPVATGSLAGMLPAADKNKLDGLEMAATADQTDAEIETAYNNQVAVVSQAEAEAGVLTTIMRWSALRVKQAIDALGSGADGAPQHMMLDSSTITEDVYYPANGSMISVGTALTTNSLILAPYYVARACTLEEIGARVTNVEAGSTFRLGLYNASATGDSKPTTLIEESTAISGAATGFITDATVSAVLAPGWYWIAVVTGHSVFKLAYGLTNLSLPVIGADASTGNYIHFISTPHTFGALPSDLSAKTWTGHSSASDGANLFCKLTVS